MQTAQVPMRFRETGIKLEFHIEDVEFNHVIVWQPDDEPEAIRLEVHPEAVLKGETLDALVEKLIVARRAVEQPSLEKRYKTLLEAGFREAQE